MEFICYHANLVLMAFSKCFAFKLVNFLLNIFKQMVKQMYAERLYMENMVKNEVRKLYSPYDEP